MKKKRFLVTIEAYSCNDMEEMELTEDVGIDECDIIVNESQLDLIQWLEDNDMLKKLNFKEITDPCCDKDFTLK